MTTSDDNDCLKHVNDFYSVLNQKLEVHRQTKRHLDRFLSTDFNVFAWIKPDEKRLSKIIANLLNPACSHGQQHAFLHAFLRRIGKDDLCDVQPPQVTCEYRIEHPESSIDVLVDFGAFVIAIENKPWPWSKEGREQLGKYSNYLKKEYKDQFCLIYLTFSGDKPVSIESDERERLMEAGNLLCISYHSNILEWLRECSQLCESDKFRGFLRDFMNYITTMEEQMSNSSERKNIGERKMILEHALASEENLETTLDIVFAFDEFRKRIIVAFLNKLEEFVLDSLGDPHASRWKVNDGSLRDFPLEKGKVFSFGEKSWGKQYGVGLTTEGANADTVSIVVYTRTTEQTVSPSKDTIEALMKKLNEIKSGDIEKYDGWPWIWFFYPDPSYQNWGSKEALIKLHNGEAVKVIGPYLVKIIEVAAPIIDEHVQKSSS